MADQTADCKHEWGGTDPADGNIQQEWCLKCKVSRPYGTTDQMADDKPATVEARTFRKRTDQLKGLGEVIRNEVDRSGRLRVLARCGMKIRDGTDGCAMREEFDEALAAVAEHGDLEDG